MEPQLRSPRKEYYEGHGNSVGRSPGWTPRSRGGLQRGEGSFGSGRHSASGSYYGQEEQHTSPAGQHDRFEEDCGLQKTLSNLSLGKTFSGSMDGSDVSGRLQRAHSRGLEQAAYPQRGQQLNGRGSGELVGFPGRMGGRGDPMPGGFGPGRGRAVGPVSVELDGVAAQIAPFPQHRTPNLHRMHAFQTSCSFLKWCDRFLNFWFRKKRTVSLLET